MTLSIPLPLMLIIGTLTATAGFALRPLLPPGCHVDAAPLPVPHLAARSAALAISMEEEGEAAEPEAAPAEAAKEEEEEEDLLSSPAFLKQKLKVLEKELEEVKAQQEDAKAEGEVIAADWVDQRTRLQTDFDNFRARHVNQTMAAQIEARVKLLQDFLPVLDNFDRARGAISLEGAEAEAVKAKYEEMHAGLMKALTDELAMEKIKTVGEEFDYNLHMAIQPMPSDEYDEGIVCSEMQPGYQIKDQLVRAAYVMVSSG